MAIVIISAEPYCRREEIAAKTAQLLGYECLGPEILSQASRRYGVPESRLEKALTEPSSLLDKISKNRWRYIAFFQASLAAALDRNNVVYHGEMGHMFVSGVSHLMTVSVTADIEVRAARMAQEEGLGIERAREALLKHSERRRRWCLSVFGTDGTDPSRFDMVIDVTRIDPDQAAARIAEAARDVKYRPLTYSIKAMKDLEIASRVRAALIDKYPDVQVRSHNGDVLIKARGLRKEKAEKLLSLRAQIEEMEGVGHVDIE